MENEAISGRRRWRFTAPPSFSPIPPYPELYANVSALLTKAIEASYSVGHRGYNEQGKEFYGSEDKGSRCCPGYIAEAGKSSGHRLHDSSSALATGEARAFQKLEGSNFT